MQIALSDYFNFQLKKFKGVHMGWDEVGGGGSR